MKYFIFLFLFAGTSITTAAQVKKPVAIPKPGKDWLLWYQGKKQNDSVLIANNGWKIMYSRSEHKVEIKTGTQNNQFQKIETELNNSKARKIDMIRRIAGDKPDPSDLATIRLVMAAVDDIDSQYRAALKPVILLPADELPLEETITKHSGPFTELQTTAGTWQEMCADINADIRSLKDPNTIDLGVPPDFDVSVCYYCDELAKKRMRQKGDDYLLTLKKDEQRIAQKLFKVFKIFDQMQVDNPGQLPQEIQDQYQVLTAQLRMIHERIITKMKRLLAKYPHDFLKMITLTPLMLGLNRQYQLMDGLGEFPEELGLSKFINAADINAYLKKLIAEEDYDRVLNVSWMLATERQLQLLGSTSMMPEGEFQRILDFNRFKLSVSADVKEERDQYFKKGQAKSEPTFYKALPSKDCKYSFIQTKDARTIGVGNAFLNFDLLQAESSAGTYIGTKKWVMIDPYIKLGFCGDDDTAKLFVIMPNLQDMVETWQTDNGPQHLPEIVGLFSDGFENNDNMIDEDDEMLEKMQAVQKFTSNLNNPEDIVLNPLGLNNGYLIVESIKENFAKNALTLVPITAKNKSTVLFDQWYNGKLFTKNEGIVYANMWIKLEHVKE